MRYLLIFLLLLTSCGTRKVNKSIEEIKQDKIETVQNNIQVKENVAIKVIDSTDEIFIEPIDSIKPMVIDGKSYLNVKIKHKKRKVNTSIVLDKTTSDTSKKKIIEKTEAVKDIKIIERKTSLVTQLWWLWLLILLFILYKFK